MNIDELKQSLATMADEAEDLGPAQRLDGVDHKVTAHRRTTALTIGVATVAAVAIAFAPTLVNRTDQTPPADHGTTLQTVTENGVSFYEAPGGARLLGYAVARPGDRSVTVRFTPSTTNLAWTDFCYDAGVTGIDKGAEYAITLNGHDLSWSTCNGKVEGPLGAEGSFADSPAANSRAFTGRYDVVAGKSSTFTVHISKHAERGVAPQPGVAVYERGPQQQDHGVWFDREVVFKGHTYRVLDSDVVALNGVSVVRAAVDLPESSHRAYVVQGAAHVKNGLRLVPDSVGLSPMSKGVTGTASGDLAPLDRRTATVMAHPRNPDAAGDVFVLVYEQVG